MPASLGFWGQGVSLAAVALGDQALNLIFEAHQALQKPNGLGVGVAGSFVRGEGRVLANAVADSEVREAELKGQLKAG